MRLAVVTAAERDHELVADLAAERAWLCEPQVMGVGGFAAADQTGLGGDEPKVLPVAVAPRLGDRQYALVDAAGLTTVRNVRVHRWGHSGRVGCFYRGDRRLLDYVQFRKRRYSLLEGVFDDLCIRGGEAVLGGKYAARPVCRFVGFGDCRDFAQQSVA